MINHTEYIEKFLLKNGFTVSEPNVFINELCIIEIILDESIENYEINNKYSYFKITYHTKDYRENATLYSDNLQIEDRK